RRSRSGSGSARASSRSFFAADVTPPGYERPGGVASISLRWARRATSPCSSVRRRHDGPASSAAGDGLHGGAPHEAAGAPVSSGPADQSDLLVLPRGGGAARRGAQDDLLAL